MARSNLLDGFAYGVINEILGTFRTQDGGYAKPSRYEVIIAPPPGYSAKVKGGPKGLFGNLPPELNRIGRGVLSQAKTTLPTGRLLGGRVFQPYT